MSSKYTITVSVEIWVWLQRESVSALYFCTCTGKLEHVELPFVVSVVATCFDRTLCILKELRQT